MMGKTPLAQVLVEGGEQVVLSAEALELRPDGTYEPRSQQVVEVHEHVTNITEQHVTQQVTRNTPVIIQPVVMVVRQPARQGVQKPARGPQDIVSRVDRLTRERDACVAALKATRASREVIESVMSTYATRIQQEMRKGR